MRERSVEQIAGNTATALIKNCEDYLKEQLQIYAPKIIIPYGNDVGKWFKGWLKLDEGFDEAFEDTTTQLNNREVHLLFVPQRQGPHSKPEILWIRNEILKLLEHLRDRNCDALNSMRPK